MQTDFIEQIEKRGNDDIKDKKRKVESWEMKYVY